MVRMVDCRILNRRAEGLDRPPYPGELGERIFQEVSREAWLGWLDQLAVLMNDHHLSSADPASLENIEALMQAHFFEGQPVALQTRAKK